MSNTEQKAFDKGYKVSVKDLVWIIMLTESILGTYYTLSGRQDILEREVLELDRELHETNIKLLEHDIKYLKIEVANLKNQNQNWHKMWDKKKGK